MKVSSNTAISLDGRINTRERRPVFLGSARDHARMSELRAEADAVLVGGATFRNWPHPALPDREHRHRLGGRRPWTVVVTRSAGIPLDTDFVADPAHRPLVLTRRSAGADGRLQAAGVDVAVHDDDGDLPVAWILARLVERGVERLLVEAGGDLLFQFIAADAIDEIHLTLCPLVVGGDAPSLVDGPGFDVAALRRFRLAAADPVGDEVFLRYVRE